jgi:hypothetical protein
MIQTCLIPYLFASLFVQTKKTNTTSSKSTMNADDMRLANIPATVAEGFSNSKMFPVSLETKKTRIFGAINPTIVRKR